MRKTLLLALVVLLAAAGQSSTGPVFSFTTTTFNAGLNGNYTNGWAFTVNRAISVQELGVLDYLGDGLSGSHEVGLWESGVQGYQLLRSATVSQSAALEGWFRYAPVSPITLTSGHTYVVGALFLSTTGDFYINTSKLADMQFDSAVTILTIQNGQVGIAAGSTLNPPVAADGNYYMDANLRYTTPSDPDPVPEPGSMILFGTGLVGAARAWRKRRA